MCKGLHAELHFQCINSKSVSKVLQNQRIHWKNYLLCKVSILVKFCRTIISKLKYQINFSPEKRDRIDVISYFMPPESKKVNEEYLLYDLIGVIGAVVELWVFALDFQFLVFTRYCFSLEKK